MRPKSALPKTALPNNAVKPKEGVHPKEGVVGPKEGVPKYTVTTGDTKKVMT